MGKKRSTIGLSKTTKNHGTYTDFARSGVEFLNGLEMVRKISPGIITPKTKSRGGGRFLRVNRVEHDGLEIKFSSDGTQAVFVSSTDREAVIKELSLWAKGEGRCLLHAQGKSG